MLSLTRAIDGRNKVCNASAQDRFGDGLDRGDCRERTYRTLLKIARFEGMGSVAGIMKLMPGGRPSASKKELAFEPKEPPATVMVSAHYRSAAV